MASHPAPGGQASVVPKNGQSSTGANGAFLRTRGTTMLTRTTPTPQGQVQTQAQSDLGERLFDSFNAHPTAWDELFAAEGGAHEHCAALVERLGQLSPAEFQRLRADADLVFVNQGITFSVYADRRGVEKIFPFDLIPRPVAAHEWKTLEAGLVQRIRALNLFIHDVYHDRHILREGIIPEDFVLQSKCYRPEMIGFDPPGRQYVHIVGSDLVREPSGRFLVLEDNGRTPSGVSYVLENRVVMKKVFPRSEE